ncbi:cyanuric acid amidohydrolase protein [Salinisphaera shabanensis E1L3A]|uniref:Cyanuric acid amidohydrolase n=1 Tax=Salinisphaera shabanensis E1L3A TaxID=1033802 RepID=U2E793_9GAMM|nr:ring-opening amidohydrolase [Salinisphaera shabanensis]ERJ19606.1 cyanuric acid amidohydrolase protein [Salinisphaera shabanensis E1L3A]
MTTSTRTTVHRIATDSPADTRGLVQLIESNALDPATVVAVFGKTEGNGCVNDFTRGYATERLQNLFASHIGSDAARRIAMVMSGGTEGVISPHLTVICRERSAQPSAVDTQALAVGVARTPELAAHDIGRRAQIQAVATATAQALQQAGIDDPDDVHYVQVKCPLLTSQKIREAQTTGHAVATTDTYKSMGYSRGASALGVAVALGEIEAERAQDETVLEDMNCFSAVASASAGSELDYCEVIVIGNTLSASGDLYARHAVMQDAIDAEAVRQALAADAPGDRVVQLFAKAEADPSGEIRGRRHTMINDSDINHTRHARAVVGGVIAALAGDPTVYVSGGAEHQGPSGGGVIAAILSRG